jgi:hypothetical protein
MVSICDHSPEQADTGRAIVRSRRRDAPRAASRALLVTAAGHDIQIWRSCEIATIADRKTFAAVPARLAVKAAGSRSAFSARERAPREARSDARADQYDRRHEGSESEADRIIRRR